ncbi:MAG: LamG domain-containing protein [Planctomycetaceae bacterium]|nr:MAG: LamG domain-containing protein [Planctomycetaceae bacterium]
MFHRKAPDWADRLGHLVKQWDPYDHLTSAHNVAHRTPKSTWLDMQLLQRWDGGQTGYMLGQRAAQEKTGYIIPQVNEEYGYEDLWEKYPGHRAAETRRKDAWEITMAVCYQTTDESARRGTGVAPDTGGGWVNGRGDDQMTMLIGYGHMVDFFTAFDGWNCQSLSEAVQGRVQLTAERSVWSTNTPPGGGSHSLDFGSKASPYAVDLPDAAREALEGLRSFTITAWLNRTSDEEGAGGNRIVHMADTLGSRAGIDLIVTRNGQLKIGVNQWPDGTQAASEPGLIPVDRNAGNDNWRFIAVTYDSTAAKEHVKLYVGTITADVRLHKAVSYDRGPVGKDAGVLTVGHFNPAMRSHHSDRMFRGLIDEVRLFGNSLDGTGALSLDEIRTIHKP